MQNMLEKGSALEKQAIKDITVTLKYFAKATPIGIYITKEDYAKCVAKLKLS